MPQTVGNAVARRDKENKLVGWLRGQQDELAMAAASHIRPATIVRVTQGALRTSDKLMAAAIANPQSLLHCLLDAARLGHEPGTDQYYLVPYGSEVTGIEGYKGIIERMFRAGGVTSVVAQVVRQRDRYAGRGENTPPFHEYDEFASDEARGPLRGVYAYATFPGGSCSQVIRMGRDEVMLHKAKSRGANGSDSPWNVWEPSMWKKTALRALEPYVPTSTEWLDARARANATAAAPPPAWPTASPQPEQPRVIPSEVIPDGPEPAEEQPSAPQPEQQRRRDPNPPRGRRQPVQATVVDAVGEELPSPPDAPPGEQATAADPHDTVIAQLDRLGVTSHDERASYLTRLTGKPVASAESLTRGQAGWFAPRLAKLGSRDELEAAAVAAEEARAEAGGSE